MNLSVKSLSKRGFRGFVSKEGHWLEVFMMLTVVLRIGVAGGSMALFLRKAFSKNELSIVTFVLLMTLIEIKCRKEAALNTLCKESSARNTEVTEADSDVDSGVKKVEETESSDQ